jgi:sigma-B regulation protein RsbU (phosphoserine phosphatase)
VKDTIEQHLEDAPQQLLDALHAMCSEFVNGAEQSDDLTMLAVKFTPKEEETIMHRKLTIDNSLSHVPSVNDFVKSFGDELKLEEKDTQNLKLAIEEAVVNVINYAYPKGTYGSIELDASLEGNELKFILSDSGKEFDPTLRPEADINAGVEDRPIGGLGVHLVRQIMDSVSYERKEGMNILTMTKNI